MNLGTWKTPITFLVLHPVLTPKTQTPIVCFDDIPCSTQSIPIDLQCDLPILQSFPNFPSHQALAKPCPISIQLSLLPNILLTSIPPPSSKKSSPFAFPSLPHPGPDHLVPSSALGKSIHVSCQPHYTQSLLKLHSCHFPLLSILLN